MISQVYRIGFISLFLLGLMMASANADLVLFHNGDFLYGKVQILDPTKEVVITVGAVTKTYKSTQVREVIKGVEAPAPGAVLRVSDFIHAASAEILTLTGRITHRQKVKNTDGKDIIADVENGFNLRSIQIAPSSFVFYNRQGTVLRGELMKSSTPELRGVEFRIFLYDRLDHLLTSQDVYFQRFPVGSASQASGQSLEIILPGIPYERINRVRIIRKY